MTIQRKIHVCHLVYSFNTGGLERIIANCINNLDSNKYEHTIIALTEVGQFVSELDREVMCFSINKKEGENLKVHVKLMKLLWQLNPDVLHSYNLSTIEYQWLAPFVGARLRVHAEHGRDTYDVDGSVTKYKLLRRIMSRFIHRFVAVSDDLAQWLMTDVSINPDKVCLIVNGVNTECFEPGEFNNDNLESLDGKFVFGHVARLHPIKNQGYIIKSFEKACSLSNRFSENSVLMLVGDGSERLKLETLVAESEILSGKVIFAGEQSEVSKFYGIFDVFVMASIAEGIPMTLLESMSMGVPHLVTNVGGIKEVVLDTTGFCLSSDDLDLYAAKMLELYEKKEQLEEMSIACRKRVIEKFSQDKMIASYDELYGRTFA